MKKVELLAPAGDYEGFLGAIHAGADAVYLGGKKFGARAYANNFSDEEVCKAIDYAHIFGRKVYLTLNTLIKEKEFPQVYDYLYCFYKSGLDGVIIQDTGIFESVGRWFPDLERHVSTQMAITGALGAAYMKEKGATRIVPARELNLQEIREIKNSVDIEIEAFVHGAMCYCYSGQCLMSSIIGGRSGNRGRCAQPCRLPYEVHSAEGEHDNGKQKEQYPLSLKDMCTLELIPDLIEAGIDSFKIEGRMKSAEYAAGVTAVYRKYIDRYYRTGAAAYHVDQKDSSRLKNLYIRTETGTGYYSGQTGAGMITLDNPGYAGKKDIVVESIRRKYIDADHRLIAEGRARLYRGRRAELTIFTGDIETTVYGDVVEEAVNKPMDPDAVIKRLLKTGNELFRLNAVNVDMEQDTFLPVKALNELRRFGCESLKEKVAAIYGLDHFERHYYDYAEDTTENTIKIDERLRGNQIKSSQLHALVRTKEQLESVLLQGIQRVYLSCDILEEGEGYQLSIRKKQPDTAFYLALPHILRAADQEFLRKIQALLEEDLFSGVLIRNIESLQWLKTIGYNNDKVLDSSLYLFNKKAYQFYENEASEWYAPLELNCHELKALTLKGKGIPLSQMIYGRIPMMVTANCIWKTAHGCRKGLGGSLQSVCSLTDRMNKKFPVVLNCRHCYNLIYNSVPLSLHRNQKEIEDAGISVFRLDFTIEDGKETQEIAAYFKELIAADQKIGTKTNLQIPFSDYTNGHFKRGVE